MIRLLRGARGIAGIVVSGLMLVSAGCESPPPPATSEPLTARFYLESKPGEAGVPVQLPQSVVTISVGSKPVITEYDIAGAEVAKVDLGLCLMIRLKPAAARDLYRLSTGSAGRRLVLALNERFVGARRIESPMTDGTILIFVEVPDAQLAAIARRLTQTFPALANPAKSPETH